MSLKHHYLNDKSYIVEVVDEITSRAQNCQKHEKALTVGCSVGRVPMELGKIFNQSIGIDCTTRYFQMSSRLKETGFLKFKDIDINLKNLNIQEENVSLVQMNPENPDERKINMCDLIFIDGYSIKKNSICEVIKNVMKLAGKNCTIVILNVTGFNQIGTEEAKKLMMKCVGGNVEAGEEKRLKISEGDQTFLPYHEDQMEFRLGFYTLEK